MLPNITTENRDGVTQADETMSDRYSFLPTAHEFAEHIDQTLNGILTYWAKEVTFDYAASHSTRVDYMVFKKELLEKIT